MKLRTGEEQREAQGEIETHHPGYLGSQDTYYVGHIKGIGRIYQQTYSYTYSYTYSKLAIENIDHTKTKARSPQTNGICQRFHKTIQDEFYQLAFRKKLYTSIIELQVDVDEWLAWYNRERSHSGKHCEGRTPLQTFRDTKPSRITCNLNDSWRLRRST